MSSNICGNCDNFKPKPGEKFFNCSSARHAGLSYGMQVRADTRSCDAFLPLKASSKRAAVPPVPPVAPGEHVLSEESPPSDEREQAVVLCSRGRLAVIASLVIAIGLVSVLLWTCASTLTSPRATPTPTPTKVATPVPTVTYQYLKPGEWAESSAELVTVVSPWRGPSYMRYGQVIGAQAGAVFIIARVSIANAGNVAFYVAPESFALFDSAGRAFGVGVYRAEGGLVAGWLSPGRTVGGTILFEVPDFISGLEVGHYLAGSPPVSARWQLPW